MDIKYYWGEKAKAPAWIDQAPNFFVNSCIVSADLSELKKSIRPRTNQKNGERYYSYRFDIILLFGLTEFKAQMAWMENGVERRGPVSIIYDEITSDLVP